MSRTSHYAYYNPCQPAAKPRSVQLHATLIRIDDIELSNFNSRQSGHAPKICVMTILFSPDF